MKNIDIKIGKKIIGKGHPVFIIAEAGANHNGDFDLAIKMIKEAKKTGADCIKFQTFTAEEFCVDKDKMFSYFSRGKKVTESEFEMFKRHEFSESQWKSIMKTCDNENIMFLTTIQDPINLKMMKKLGLKAIKVGSDDFDHIVNLNIYSKSGLPIILSKGMSDLNETKYIINKIKNNFKNRLAILHCVSLYPSNPEYLNLNQITTLKNLFPDIVWGFSDHSQSTISSSIAVALGASIIEKHFTLDHNFEGPDHWFSMNPKEFKELVDNIRYTEKVLGNGRIHVTHEEKNTKKIMRRRILLKRNLNQGSVITDNDVIFKRFTNGAFAVEWDNIKGKQLLKDKMQNDPLFLRDVF